MKIRWIKIGLRSENDERVWMSQKETGMNDSQWQMYTSNPVYETSTNRRRPK